MAEDAAEDGHPSFSAWDSAPCEPFAAEKHGKRTDSAEEQQIEGTDCASVCAWHSASWEPIPQSMPDAGTEWCEVSEKLERSPSFLQDEADEAPSPSGSPRHETDRDCSDVDLDNDWIGDRDSDSEFTMESLELQKENKWLRPFFEVLNDAANTEHERASTLFYCPACRGSGLGETDLYKGLHPLITHGKKYTKRRVKLHRQFAFILEDDLKGRNSSATHSMKPSPAQRLQMEDLNLEEPHIVWPPTVLIRTSQNKLEVHEKRVTTDAKHLLEVFKDYHPRRVRHAYDPESHLGFLSLLIFQDSPVGYMHAKHLVKMFKCSGKGRKQWEEYSTRKLQSSCVDLMYAYMATARDLVLFDTCDASRKNITWSMKSYKDAIMQPLGDLGEAKLKNCLLKAQLQDQEGHKEFLEKALCKLYGNLELTDDETYAVQRIASQIQKR